MNRKEVKWCVDVVDDMCYLVPQYIGVWGGPEEGGRVEARPLAPGRRPPLLCQAHPRTEICNSHIYCYLGSSYFILFIHSHNFIFSGRSPDTRKLLLLFYNYSGLIWPSFNLWCWLRPSQQTVGAARPQANRRKSESILFNLNVQIDNIYLYLVQSWKSETALEVEFKV